MRGFKLRYWILWPLRRRLTCPYCSAVGTYKPFPRLVVDRTWTVPRRFLCKNCGRYENEHGRFEDRCKPDKERGCWTLPEDLIDPKPTPRKLHKKAKINPWVG